MKVSAATRRPIVYEIVQELRDRVVYQVDKVGTFTLTAGGNSWSVREEDPHVVSVICGHLPPSQDVNGSWRSWREWAGLPQLPTVHRVTVCGRNSVSRDVITQTLTTEDYWDPMRWGRGVARAADGAPCPDGVAARIRFVMCTLATDFLSRTDHEQRVRRFRAEQAPARTHALDTIIERKAKELNELQAEIDALVNRRDEIQSDLTAQAAERAA